MSTLVIYRRLTARRSQRWRWRLVASNGRKIANGGEGYANKDECAGIAKAIISGAYADTSTVYIDG